jgi:type I restriction enzyme S subunit
MMNMKIVEEQVNQDNYPNQANQGSNNWVMSEWKKEILSQHIGLRHGYQFRESDFTEAGIQVIKIGNVTNDGLNLESDVSYVDISREREFESITIKDGDILMSLTGNIGRVVEVSHLGNRILFQNYRVGVFYPLKENIYKPFIKWILCSADILRQLNSHSNQSAQANFGKQDLDKLTFQIPTLLEQHKITQILITTETVIEKTQDAIAKYNAIKQGMLHDLFTRGIDVKTGKLRPRYEDAPELYKESKLHYPD